MRQGRLQQTLAIGVVGCGVWAGATAPVRAADRAERNDASSVVTVKSAGLEALLSDPRDASLVRALRMLDDRVMELPRELDEDEIPADAITFALDVLFSAKSLRIGLAENPANPDMPLFAQLDVMAEDANAARNYDDRLVNLMALGGIDHAMHQRRGQGVMAVDVDGMALLHGAQKRNGRDVFSVGIDELRSSAASVGDSILPDGVDPTLAFRLDTTALSPMLRHLEQQVMQNPEMAGVIGSLRMAGLDPDSPLVVRAMLGHGDDRAYAAVRVDDYVPVMTRMGTGPDNLLTKHDFRPVPRDAQFASVGKWNATTYVDSMAEGFRQMMGLDEGDPLDMVEQMIGIHPRRDMLNHLGTTFGAYSSPSTGGGLLCTRRSAEVTNPQALRETFVKIIGMANAISKQGAQGYVRIESTDMHARRVTVLRFPGLPIPLELAFTQADGYLLAALSPQALLAGVDQLMNDHGTLLDHPRFVEMGGSIDNSVKAEFMDTPACMRSGYMLVNMGMAALSNVVRSPRHRDREPGFIMPSYDVLAKDAKATVTMTRIDGDDLLIETQCDRSLLANVCGTAGLLMDGGGMALAGGAMSAGLLLPALEQARESARSAKAANQGRSIGMAYAIYQSEHDGVMPNDPNDIVAYVGPDALRSEFGPSPDGGADFWLDLSGRDIDGITMPSRYIIAVDRAAYHTGADRITVVFADGHVEMLSTFELQEHLRRDVNSHVDLNQIRRGVSGTSPTAPDAATALAG